MSITAGCIPAMVSVSLSPIHQWPLSPMYGVLPSTPKRLQVFMSWSIIWQPPSGRLSVRVFILNVFSALQVKNFVRQRYCRASRSVGIDRFHDVHPGIHAARNVGRDIQYQRSVVLAMQGQTHSAWSCRCPHLVPGTGSVQEHIRVIIGGIGIPHTDRQPDTVSLEVLRYPDHASMELKPPAGVSAQA